MTRYLRKERKENLKESFSLSKFGWIYKPQHREIGLYLSFDEMSEIHDFIVFQSSQEYLDWVKVKAKGLHNG